MPAIKEHTERHGITYVITGVLGLAPVIALTLTVTNYFASVAYVDSEIESHVASLEHKVTRILESNLAQQINAIYRARCETGRGDINRDLLRRLREEYRVLTGHPYEKPSCSELGVEDA